ncbi:CitMHS family transporter [Succinispira mobilis]|uniref:CitMHS family transporter n=1 Tax=Succinispira mobilis TaxID=78120 RepID=UPI00036400D3|nr:citrate:proton symporter [Succinispira mobilis]
MLAFIGILMVVVIIYCLMQSKATPSVVFILVPIIAAFLAGFSFDQISGFIKSGVTTTWSIAVLFIFSIVYFGVMSDAGMFDPLVNYLTEKAGANVIMVTVATALIATISHLDGALATTLLITVPAMLPIYKKLNIRPVVLLVIIGAAMSIMNLLPWGGPVARTVAITKMDVNLLWQSLIPLQIVGLIIVVGFAAAMGIMEKRRGAGLKAGATLEDGSEGVVAEELDPKVLALKRPKLVWFNILLTVGVIALLCLTKVPLYGAFMIGLALALLVNYPKASDQAARIKAHAAEALSVPAILLASGIFLGVLSGTKMLTAMATAIINVIPAFVGPYLHIVLGIFSVPIGMLLGTDSFFFGLVPLAIGVGSQYGIEPTNMAKAMLIGKNFGVLVTPHAATTYLAIGLAGIDIKELLRFCTPLLWLVGIISLACAVVMGIVVI